MRRILIATLLASGLILPSVQAQEDLCETEAIITSFAEATDIVVWSQQYSACPSQVQRAVRTLAAGYQLLTTDVLPFAAADDVSQFNPLWNWYPGEESSYSIDSETNLLYLVAGRMTEQRDDITTAPLLAYPVVGDITAQVKISFNPIDEQNGAALGIRAANDPTSWIRIARVGDEIQVTGTARGTSTVIDSQPYESDTLDLYFKIERVGDLFTLSYSVNGSDWEVLTSDSNETFPEETEIFLTTFWPQENGAAQAAFSEMIVSED